MDLCHTLYIHIYICFRSTCQREIVKLERKLTVRRQHTNISKTTAGSESSWQFPTVYLEVLNSFFLITLLSSALCHKTEAICYHNTYSTSSEGRGYERCSAKSHFNRLIWSLSVVFYNSITERNTRHSNPSIIFTNRLHFRTLSVYWQHLPVFISLWIIFPIVIH
jgi:hypothetical protein